MANATRWLVLSCVVWLAARPLSAAACEYVDDSAVYDVLGVPSRLAFEQPADLQLPRNVALVFFSRDSGRPRLFAADTPVELELLGVEPAHGDFGLQSPVEPLTPGVTYTYNGSQLEIADYIDARAPEPAQVHHASLTVSDYESACGFGSSCDSTVFVRARVGPGMDDHTPAERLTYAIYLGVSPRAALATPQVERYVVRDDAGEISTRAAFEWSEGDVYMSVSVLDHAGNESPRSQPIQIYNGSSGCRVHTASGLDSFLWIIAALLWQVTRRRS